MKKFLFFFILFFMSLNLYSSEEYPTENEVVKLYVATFNRAPDYKGISYWLSSGLKLSQIAESFFDQPETKNKYPQTLDKSLFVDNIYRNILGREPDSAGKEYWLKELDEGRVTRQNFILAIMNGAKGNDAILLNNKMEIGKYFAFKLKMDDTKLAHDVMQSVTKDNQIVNLIKNKLDGCKNKKPKNVGSIEGTISTTLSQNIRKVLTMEGGLWLTPNIINTAVKVDRSLNCEIDYDQNKPISIAIKSKSTSLKRALKDINITKIFRKEDIPTGKYSLIYIDEEGKGTKIEDIFIKPNETTTQNITRVYPTGDVKLKIVGVDKKPLENVKVRVNEFSQRNLTGEYGEVSFKRLPKGEYSLNIDKKGFVSKYKKFKIEEDKVTDLGVITLDDNKGDIEGVVEVEGVTNFANVIVYLKDKDGEIFSTLTDEKGNYRLESLPVGEFSITAYARGYKSSQIDNIVVKKDRTTIVDTMVLKKEVSEKVGSIVGYARFSDSDVEDFSNIEVSIKELADKKTTTLKDGSFVLNDVKAGLWTLLFNKDNLETSKVVRVIEGAKTYIDNIQLHATSGALKLKVADKIGAIKGALVTISNLNESYFTDKNGTVTITDIPIGKYKLTITKEGYNSKTKDIEIKGIVLDMTSTPIYLTEAIDESGRAFITRWNTENPGKSDYNQIMIPTNPDYTYNYNIDWGDGTKDMGVTGDITHTYSKAGIYTIKIKGEFPHLYQYNSKGGENDKKFDNDKLLSVEQWGDIRWKSMHDMFYDCLNVVINAEDSPKLSQVKDMSYMFYRARNFNQDINNWDVSNVTNMAYMFSYAKKFNQPLDKWNTYNVTNMEGMFYYAISFNQNINDWDVSKVTNMSNMFREASKFNQPLDKWDVSHVIYMSHMFEKAISFNQDISSWDVHNVEYMKYMFYKAKSFSNQDLSSWDVRSVVCCGAWYFSDGWGEGNKGPNW